MDDLVSAAAGRALHTLRLERRCGAGAASHRAPTDIRERELLELLYRTGCPSPRRSGSGERHGALEPARVAPHVGEAAAECAPPRSPFHAA